MQPTLDRKVVDKLSEETGASRMRCYTALKDSQGDVTQAKALLTEYQKSVIKQKSSLDGHEGGILAGASPQGGFLLEINCQTDFVAKSDTFREFAQHLSPVSLSLPHNASLSDFMKAPFSGNAGTVQNAQQDLISKLKENIILRRFSKCSSPKTGLLFPYVHNPLFKEFPHIGSSAALVSLSSPHPDPQDLEKLAKEIALHAIAMDFLGSGALVARSDQLDKDLIARKEKEFTEEAYQAKRPEKVIPQIVKGRLDRYLKDIVWENQETCLDDSRLTLRQIMDNYAHNFGTSIQLQELLTFSLTKPSEN